MSSPYGSTSYQEALDREIVLTRLLDAPRAAVYAAWVGDDVDEWFGPEGFTCTTHERDVRPGGRWRFDFTTEAGDFYGNRIVYLEVVQDERLVFEHGSDIDDDPDRFLVTVTFDEQSNGKTVLTLRQLHPSRERRDGGIGFGAVEYGIQTLDKLARHVGA
jgi:uncharacterized protein YndB with AHSA1/START domain